jgi:hypothetical protein
MIPKSAVQTSVPMIPKSAVQTSVTMIWQCHLFKKYVDDGPVQKNARIGRPVKKCPDDSKLDCSNKCHDDSKVSK